MQPHFAMPASLQCTRGQLPDICCCQEVSLQVTWGYPVTGHDLGTVITVARPHRA